MKFEAKCRTEAAQPCAEKRANAIWTCLYFNPAYLGDAAPEFGISWAGKLAPEETREPLRVGECPPRDRSLAVTARSRCCRPRGMVASARPVVGRGTGG